jgi:hypothetical protein
MLFLLLLLLTSCGTTALNDPEKTYLKDLEVRHEADNIQGFGVLPERDVYHLKFRSRHSPEYVHIQSCHRDLVLRDQKKIFTYTYIPAKGLEDSGGCLLQVAAFDKKGHHQWLALDFYGGEKLQSIVACNGSLSTLQGASTCQGRVGSLQQIRFGESVDSLASDGCSDLTTDNNKEFFIQLTKDFCIYTFYGVASDSFHRLTTYGYEDIMQRE